MSVNRRYGTNRTAMGFEAKSMGLSYRAQAKCMAKPAICGGSGPRFRTGKACPWLFKVPTKFWKGRSVVCFQPHRYSRTKRLFKRFGRAFHQADVLVLTKLYPAGEKEIPGVSTRMIYDSVKESGHREVYHIEERKELIQFLKKFLRKGDLLVTMGAGDIWKIGDELLKNARKT